MTELQPAQVVAPVVAMSAQPLPPETVTRVEQLVQAADRAVVDSALSLEKGADLDKLLAVQIKKLEDARLVLASPLDKALKAWNGLFKTQRDRLENSRKVIDRKMKDYRLAELRAEQARIAAEQKAREEAALAEAAAKEQEARTLAAQGLADQAEARQAEAEQAFEEAADPLPLASSVPAGPVRGDLGGVTSFSGIVLVFKEITNPALVPREYCEPSESLIKKAIKAGVKSIPGVLMAEDVTKVTR